MGSPFLYERRVRFADVDPAGIVYYPVYYDMLNETIETWFLGPLDYGFRQIHIEERRGMPLAETHAKFYAASRIEDLLTFELHVADISRVTVDCAIRVRCGESHRFSALQRIIYTTLEPVKAISIPDWLSERMRPFCTEEAAQVVREANAP